MTSKHTISKPKGKAKRARRVCLSCGKKFNSAGIHNRICKPCKYAAGEINHDEFKVAA